MSVPNKLSENPSEDEQIPVSLKFQTLRDFEPESIAEQVPELRPLIELREDLKALKGPLGNLPECRKKLQELIQAEGTRHRTHGDQVHQDTGTEAQDQK